MNTGDRIKQRRIELGLTADDLAQKIGKSRATIYRYENGDIENMPTPILEPLAKALDTTPADLMGWTSSHSGIAIERKTSNSKGQYQRFSLYADKLMKLYDQSSIVGFILRQFISVIRYSTYNIKILRNFLYRGQKPLIPAYFQKTNCNLAFIEITSLFSPKQPLCIYNIRILSIKIQRIFIRAWLIKFYFNFVHITLRNTQKIIYF